ncbi:MAG: hypothetical protein RID11_14495 [Roseovarius sp.]|uniref:hypothetical protein n=1 Tax=Roseovarius sp. TaxID=1486281 RepID=UPI0032EF9BD9
MTYIEFALFGLAAACCAALAALIALSLRQGRTLGALNRRALRPNEADLDIIAHKLGTKLGLSEDASLGTLSDRMDEMRRDFDWLVSDRMIEQAVDMARLGQNHDSIAQSTGVSSAELDAIRKLRRH